MILDDLSRPDFGDVDIGRLRPPSRDSRSALAIRRACRSAAATAPPPPPPVATCPQSDFVVYFEWDRSNLNSQALRTDRQRRGASTRVQCLLGSIVGHTDTSGSTAYNVGLSERRASVVRDALTSRGLNSSLITMQARGECELARPTRDGVREPLNRRTAVTISFQ